MKRVMLDLETMGSGPKAAIVSIGACFFELETGEIGETFERIINLEDSEKFGQIDGGTVLWWLKQDEESRVKLNSPDAVGLSQAIADFSEFIGSATVAVWGNGSGFDNVILRSAYSALDIEEPWKFWNDRDVRTMVELGRDLLGFDPKKDMPFEGVPHSALDDAKHQARYVSAIYQKLKGRLAEVVDE